MRTWSWQVAFSLFVFPTDLMFCTVVRSYRFLKCGLWLVVLVRHILGFRPATKWQMAKSGHRIFFYSVYTQYELEVITELGSDQSHVTRSTSH